MYNNKLGQAGQKQIKQDEGIDYNWSDSTVLVIEDDMNKYKMTEKILHSTGINILHAENGYKAIDYVHLNPQINLVLIDGNFPDISNFETTREILDVNPLLPIIAQTISNTESFIKAGCVDYINKPVSKKSLVRKMSKYLLQNS